MRGFVTYLAAGILVVLAMDMAVRAWPAPEAIASLQTVNRSGKSDRLILPVVAKEKAPAKRPSMMVGCDPAFSPLSTSAHVNFAARCVA